MVESGIYKIMNIINGKIYIGSSVNIKNRFKQHRCNLRKDKHPNKHLQSAWNKYGEKAFEFSIIEVIEDLDILLNREQYWIDKSKSYDRDFGYNILKNAGTTLGFKHSEESKKKLSKSISGENHYNYGKKLSEATKKKISKSHMGLDYSNRKLPDEAYVKIGKTRREKFASGEWNTTKEYLSKLNTGENHPRAKLTEEDIINILKEYKSGKTTYKKLAEKYNLSESYISFIVNGRNWSYLKERYPELYK